MLASPVYTVYMCCVRSLRIVHSAQADTTVLCHLETEWRSRELTGSGHFLHQVGLPLTFLVSGKYNHPGKVLDSLGPTNGNIIFLAFCFHIMCMHLCLGMGTRAVLADKG